MYYCNIGSTLVLASCYLCIHALYIQNYYKQQQKKNQCYALAPLLYEQYEHCHVAFFAWPYTVCDEWVVVWSMHPKNLSYRTCTMS